MENLNDAVLERIQALKKEIDDGIPQDFESDPEVQFLCRIINCVLEDLNLLSLPLGARLHIAGYLLLNDIPMTWKKRGAKK